MSFDENLAERIRVLLADRNDVTEKKMFGGLVFLVGGNMAVAASGKGGLMVRCDPAVTEDHVVDGADPMIMRGKPMNGWLHVAGDRLAGDGALAHWVRVGSTRAGALPTK